MKPKTKTRFLYRGWITATFLAVIPLLGPHLSAQKQGRPGSSDYVTVVVGPYGFQQEKLKARPGRIEFLIVNRSGIENLTVTIRRAADGVRLRDTAVPKNRRDLPEIAEMGTGDYILSVVSQPQWILPLRVEPR